MSKMLTSIAALAIVSAGWGAVLGAGGALLLVLLRRQLRGRRRTP